MSLFAIAGFMTAAIVLIWAIAVYKIDMASYEAEARSRKRIVSAIAFALVAVTWGTVVLSSGSSQKIPPRTASVPERAQTPAVQPPSQPPVKEVPAETAVPCPHPKKGSSSLKGPRQVGPDPRDPAAYRVRGARIHRVVFYVNGVLMKDDRTAPFSYKTRANRLKAKDGRRYGLYELKSLVYYAKCTLPKGPAVRLLKVRWLKPHPVRSHKAPAAVVPAVRPPPAQHPAPVQSQRPAPAVRRPAPKPKKKSSPTRTTPPYNLGG